LRCSSARGAIALYMAMPTAAAAVDRWLITKPAEGASASPAFVAMLRHIAAASHRVKSLVCSVQYTCGIFINIPAENTVFLLSSYRAVRFRA
jgi:hypothetical protein